MQGYRSGVPDDNADLPEYEDEQEADHQTPADLIRLHELIELRDAKSADQ